MSTQRNLIGTDTIALLLIKEAKENDLTARFTKQFSWQCEDLIIRILLPEWPHPYHDYSRIVKKYVLYYHMRSYLAKISDVLRENGYSVKSIVDRTLVVDTSIQVHAEIHEFWTNSHGWAPDPAAELLSRSRLDRLLSLAYSLKLWLSEPTQEDHDGRLILAWANLGALLEGVLKFFLCVFLMDYKKNPITKNKREGLLDPDELTLHDLKVFYEKHVWVEREKNIWSPWLQRMIEMRNAIHAFRDREIYSFDIFHEKASEYLDLLIALFDRVPWPDLR